MSLVTVDCVASYHWSKYLSVMMISVGIAVATVASTDCVVSILFIYLFFCVVSYRTCNSYMTTEHYQRHICHTHHYSNIEHTVHKHIT